MLNLLNRVNAWVHSGWRGKASLFHLLEMWWILLPATLLHIVFVGWIGVNYFYWGRKQQEERYAALPKKVIAMFPWNWDKWRIIDWAVPTVGSFAFAFYWVHR